VVDLFLSRQHRFSTGLSTVQRQPLQPLADRRWITKFRVPKRLGSFDGGAYISPRHRTRKRTVIRRTLLVTESGFPEATTLRSNRVRAGRKPAASDRCGTRDLVPPKGAHV
jgi:hypothetical protein